MRTEKNTLKWLLAGLFLIASLAVAFVLFQLPGWLPQYSSAIDLTVVQELSPILQRVYFTVGVALAIGLSAIALLINTKSDAQNQMIRHQASAENDSQENKTSDNSEDDIYLGDAEALMDTVSDTEEVFRQALSEVCHALEASQAAAFKVIEDDEQKLIELFASFAYHVPEGEQVTFRFGEGIAGQVAKEGKVANIDAVPEGYVQILSGLGRATPNHLLVVPIKEEEQVTGVIELASFKPFDNSQVFALENYFGKLALKLSNNDNVRLEEAKE
ncbi:MAG: GAF domain-containing protein [Cyclobacteriaceae bacterium]|jgi:putative methionine-R-sulfoxide reductase with GAF domain